MASITAKDFREALAGLPDDAPVTLHIWELNEFDDPVEIELVGVQPFDIQPALIINLQVSSCDEDESAGEFFEPIGEAS